MRVRSDDLLKETRDVLTLLQALVEGPGPSTPLAVWSIYARTEKTVAILRYRLGVERPGLRLEIPRSQAPEPLLRRALESMKDAAAQLEKEELPQALASLRVSRNGLRGFLTEGKRAERRTRVRRAAASGRLAVIGSSTLRS